MRKNKMLLLLVTMAAAAVLAGFCGCDDNNSLAPFEPEVVNVTDSFSLQATGVTNRTLTKNYTWENTGTTANVNQSTTVTAGEADLTILDANGDEVYTADLANNGTFVTSAGEAGDWTIRMRLVDYSGTINFSTEKP